MPTIMINSFLEMIMMMMVKSDGQNWTLNSDRHWTNRRKNGPNKLFARVYYYNVDFKLEKFKKKFSRKKSCSKIIITLNNKSIAAICLAKLLVMKWAAIAAAVFTWLPACVCVWPFIVYFFLLVIVLSSILIDWVWW